MCTCIGRLACRRGGVYVYVHWVTSLQEREGVCVRALGD